MYICIYIYIYRNEHIYTYICIRLLWIKLGSHNQALSQNEFFPKTICKNYLIILAIAGTPFSNKTV